MSTEIEHLDGEFKIVFSEFLDVTSFYSKKVPELIKNVKTYSESEAIKYLRELEIRIIEVKKVIEKLYNERWFFGLLKVNNSKLIDKFSLMFQKMQEERLTFLRLLDELKLKKGRK